VKWPPLVREASTSFCEQKEAKKLCSRGNLATPVPQTREAEQKFFGYFFSKK
jgi:hypothetical protein